jgi:hypothetical protein
MQAGQNLEKNHEYFDLFARFVSKKNTLLFWRDDPLLLLLPTASNRILASVRTPVTDPYVIS